MTIACFHFIKNLVQSIKSRGQHLVEALREHLPLSKSQNSRSSTHSGSRYVPCAILQKHHIPVIVWFEDALFLYGSDTAVFDLYLLVADVPRASAALKEHGYVPHEKVSLFQNDDIMCRGGQRLELLDSSDSSDSGIVLIDASDWNYDMTKQDRSVQTPVPLLGAFVSSLAKRWLSLTEEEYRQKYLWSLSLVNLINYAYNIPGSNGELVRSTEFARQLDLEVHELHYDLISTFPQKCGISLYGKHEYHAMRRQQILSSTFTARPYVEGQVPPSLAEYPRLTGLDIPETVPNQAKFKSVRVPFCVFSIISRT